MAEETRGLGDLSQALALGELPMPGAAPATPSPAELNPYREPPAGQRWLPAVPIPRPVPVPAPGGLPVPALRPPMNSLAVTSLVLGLLSVTCAGIFAAIPAIVLGHLARHQMQQRGGQGNSFALAGLILGYVAIGLIAAWVLIELGIAIVVLVLALQNG